MHKSILRIPFECTTFKLLILFIYFIAAPICKANTFYTTGSSTNFILSDISQWTDAGTANPTPADFTSGLHNFVITTGNTVTCDLGSFNCDNLTMEEGATLDMNDKPLTISGTINLGGILNLKNSAHSIPSIQTYGTLKAGKLIISGSSWTGLQTVTGNFLSTPTNTIAFQGTAPYPITIRDYPTVDVENTISASTLTVNGNLNIKSGGLTVSADLIFSATNVHTIVVNPGSNLALADLTILGNTELTNGYTTITGTLTVTSPSTFTNNSLLFEINGSGTIAGTGNFVNKKTLNYNSSTPISMLATKVDFNTYPNGVLYQQGGASPLIDSYDNIVFRGSYNIPTGTLITRNLLLDNNGGTSQIKLSDGTTVIINDTLSFTNNFSTLDFGTGNASVTVGFKLLGNANSTIIHNPSTGKTQQLILKGATNNLATYTTSGSVGTCEVHYVGTNQSIFPSNNYKDLYLDGTGGNIKSVTGPISVANKLTIKNSILQIGDQDLNFVGPPAAFTWTNGWVSTTGTGVLMRKNAGANIVFPVGTNTTFQPIQLESTDANASVRYGTPSTTLPFAGTNSWRVYNGLKTTTISFIDPIGYNLNAHSKVAQKAAAWTTLTSTISSDLKKVSASVDFSSGTTKELSVFNCSYSFSPSPSVLANGFDGVPYNEQIQWNNGTGSYFFVDPFEQQNFMPPGLTISINKALGNITINGTPSQVGITSFPLIITDGTGCQDTTSNYSITILSAQVPTTTWNGTSWDNGIPTAAMEVILAGDYNTATNGNLVGNNITVNVGFTLVITATTTVTASNNINNFGTINQDCNGKILAATILNNPVAIVVPAVTPTTLPIAMIGSPYAVTSTVTQLISPTWTITGLPSGLTAANNIISGTPTIAGVYSVTVIATEGNCSGKNLDMSLIVSTQVTTWNGTSWSNGIPTSTSDVVLNGNYSTATNGPINSNNLSIATGVVFTITGTQTVSVLGNLSNSGTINQSCTADLTVGGTRTGNPAILQMPILNPSNANFILGRVGDALSQQFSTNITPSNPLYSITIGTLPSGLSFSTAGKLSGTPTNIDAKIVEITCTDNACIVQSKYSILISDLPSPNMFVFPIQPKTYGDADFYVQSHSPSTAPITYSISNTNACASINTTTGLVTILCAGPPPNNIVTVTATQAANTLYSADIATQTFVISPKKTILTVKKNAFIVGTNDVIPYTTNSPGIVGFLQLTGISFATTSISGGVQPIAEGSFNVQIKIPATDNYTAFDSTFNFNVFIVPQAPVAIRDAVALEMNQQITFNVLDNDYGITDSLITGSTDVDVRYTGLQINYYLTQLGSIEIDQSGNCTYIPFSGFIGTDSIGYTITDARGLTSEVAYISFTVNPPAVSPPLQSNQIITPNNDGSNDALVVAYTDINAANTISISDEVGNVVFKQDNYRNNWTGLSNSGNSLEPGMYYMVFIETESGRSLYNYIQIVR